MHYLAIVLVAFGTYMARFLPLRFKLRFKNIDELLSYSSVAIISALFVISLKSLPVEDSPAIVLALVAVLLSYAKSRNLGLSLLIGIVAYFISKVLLTIAWT